MQKNLNRLLALSTASIALSVGTVLSVASATAQDTTPTAAPQDVQDEECSTADGAECAEDIIIVRGTRLLATDFVTSKRDSTNIVDGISEDELVSLPAQNAAEVLGRLPAIVALPDLGVTDLDAPTTNEARFVSVRGIRSDLNITTLNGLNLAIPNQSGRSNFLDFFPVNLASRIEAVKTFNAENDGNAIGGQINVVARNGFDYDETLFTVNGSIRFDQFRRSVADYDQPFEVAAVFASPISDSVAVALSANWNRRDVVLPSRDNVGRVYYPGDNLPRAAFPSFNNPNPDQDAPGNGFATPLRNQFISRAVNTDRYGFSGKVDFRFADESEAWLLAAYSVLDQDITTATNEIHQNIFCFGFVGCSTTVADQTATRGTLTVRSRNPDNQFAVAETGRSRNLSELLTVQAHYERAFGDSFSVQVTSGWSRASQEQQDSFERFSLDSVVEIVYDYDFSDPINPTFAAADPDTIFDPDSYELRRITSLGLDLKEDLFDVNLVLAYNADGDDEGFGFKAGFRFKNSQRNFTEFFQQFDTTDDANPILTIGDVVSPVSGEGLHITGVNPRFLTVFGDSRAVQEAVRTYLGNALGGGQFAGDGDNLRFLQFTFNDLRNRYALTESTYAGFGFAQYKSERLYINAGLRYEHTDNSGSGFAIDPTNGADLDRSDELFVPVSNVGSQGYWLPSAQLNYDITDNLKIRLAYSRSLGRPNFLDLAPRGESRSLSIDLDNQTFTANITVANPDLQPRKSNNFDVAIEWYLDDGAGIVSIGGFYKDISDEIFNFVNPNQMREFFVPATNSLQQFNTTISTTLNAQKSGIYGLEVNFVKDFSFIPGAFFEKMGIIANATFIDGFIDAPIFDDTTGTITESVRTGVVPQQPRRIYNVGLFYTDDKFDASVGYNHVGDYVIAFFPTQQEINVYQASTHIFSAKVSYRFNDHFQIFLQGANLSSEDNVILSGDPALRSVRQRYEGQRSISFGVVYKY